jgi:hypothetical protein
MKYIVVQSVHTSNDSDTLHCIALHCIALQRGRGWCVYIAVLMVESLWSPFWLSLILTLNRHADDHDGPWPSRGAGQYTDEKL